VAVLLLGGAALGYFLYVRHQSRDVRGSPTVEFVPTSPPAVRTKPPPAAAAVAWPTFGFDPQHTRFAPISSLRPPFRQIWVFRAHTLLEFPPAIAYGRLYLATNAGLFFALKAATGKTLWRFDSGRCVAASPAVAAGVVYEAFLNRPPCNSQRSDLDGRVIAFDARTGKVRWQAAIGPSESSPLVARGLVYVGDWRGIIYALDARTGRVRWSYRTGDKVKGAVALSGGRVYAGSYDGHVYALDARTGKLRWRAAGQAGFGGLGTFYSTPALAYGRLYIGSTDGKIYSFGAASGDLRWSHSTGGYVYGSPAVWRQLVLVGSYGGRFYAFDAATGDQRWEFQAGGPVSGSATVLDGVVYLATLKGRTYALDAASGRELWTWPDGKYSPVVADAKRLYLVGHTRLYGMVAK
jgi:outer membrane protein assembly factor BamB